jgi:hypothetical protein
MLYLLGWIRFGLNLFQNKNRAKKRITNASDPVVWSGMNKSSVRGRMVLRGWKMSAVAPFCALFGAGMVFEQY